MNIEIISTGNELLTGAVLDTNSQFLAEQCTQNGYVVTRQHTVGDDQNALAELCEHIGRRADFAVVTGGLGPTLDDITAAALAQAAQVPVVLFPAALANIQAFFKKIDRPMCSADQKQAHFPDSAEVFENPRGSAPGFQMTIGKCLFYCLPGVPKQMQDMFLSHVVPNMRQRSDNTDHTFILKTLSTFDISEAKINDHIADIPTQFPGVTVGTRASAVDVQIKLYTQDHPQALENATTILQEHLAPWIFSTEGESMEAVVGKLLQQNNATLAVAESCTGGLIAHWLTNVPGSSNYFQFSGVTYANSAKEIVLDVPHDLIQQEGAVSKAVVKSMAKHVRQKLNTTYGLAISGVAGPAGGTPEKPVGTVCIAVASSHATKVYQLHCPSRSRLTNKMFFAMTALNILRKKLI